jgi:coenzyme F420-reducing hydrogenase delta subunit
MKLLYKGKDDALYLLEAFLAGADAVMVSSCEIGDGYFLEGNLWTKERVAHVNGSPG